MSFDHHDAGKSLAQAGDLLPHASATPWPFLNRIPAAALAAMLILAIIAVFAQVLWHDVAWDDHEVIYTNENFNPPAFKTFFAASFPSSPSGNTWQRARREAIAAG